MENDSSAGALESVVNAISREDDFFRQYIDADPRPQVIMENGILGTAEAAASSNSTGRDNSVCEDRDGAPRPVWIVLKISDSKHFDIEVPQESTASQFRDAASAATGIPLSGLRLIFRGRIIRDDDDAGVFEKYNIANKTVVHCIGKPGGRASLKSDSSIASGEAAVSGHAAARGETCDSNVVDDDPLANLADKVLILAVYNEEWEEVRRLLRFGLAARRLAEYQEAPGRTALHCAATRKTPPDILLSLASLYPEALLFSSQRNLAYPLLLTTEESTVLQLLARCPEASSVADDCGETFLHHVLRHYRNRGSAAVVHELLRIAPAGINALNNNLQTPLHYFFRDSNWGGENALTGPTNNRACSEDEMVQMSSCLLRASLIGRTAANDDVASWWLELHASIRAHGCPWSRVLGVFLRRYRRQCAVQDSSGSYPLHLVCASNKPRDADWREAAGDILSDNTEAASKVDVNGNLPLHLYFRSGAPFEEAPLNDVFNTFPEALSAKNKRGFTPLHVALLNLPLAVDQTSPPSNEELQSTSLNSNEMEPRNGSAKGEDERELSRINSVYWLLKKDPSAIDVALRWENGDSRKKMRT